MIKKNSDNVLEITSLVVGVAFLGSLLYCLGFSEGMNIGIGTLPFSINDIINSFLFWLKSGMIGLITIYGFAVISSLFDKDIPEEKLSLSSFRKSPYFLIEFSVLYGVAHYLVVGVNTKTDIYIYGFAFAALLLLIIAKKNKIIKERISDVIFLPASLFVVFLTIAFCTGYIDGKFPNKNLFITTVKVGNKTKKIHVLRILEKGILGYDVKKSSSILLFPWDIVEQVKVGATRVQKTAPLSRIWQYIRRKPSS